MPPCTDCVTKLSYKSEGPERENGNWDLPFSWTQKMGFTALGLGFKHREWDKQFLNMGMGFLLLALSNYIIGLITRFRPPFRQMGKMARDKSVCMEIRCQISLL